MSAAIERGDRWPGRRRYGDRLGQAARLRPRQASGERILERDQGADEELHADGSRHGPRDAAVYGPRTGRRTDRRCTHRHLRARCRPVRDGDGTPPFHGTSPASLAAAILTFDPAPVSSLVGTAPVSLDRIVTKCLCKNAEDRWQSAQDLASALRWSADDSRPSHRTPHLPAVRRSRSLAIALSFVVAGALLSTALWAWPGRRPGAAAPQSPLRSRTFRPGTLHRCPVRPRWRHHRLQRGLGRRSLCPVHDPADSVESRRLDVPDARLLGVSSGRARILRGGQDTSGCSCRRAERCFGVPSRAPARGRSSTTSWPPIGTRELRISRLSVVIKWSFRSAPESMAPTTSTRCESRRMDSIWPWSKRAAGTSSSWIVPAGRRRCHRDGEN